MTEKDVLMAASGTDVEGTTKSLVVVETKNVDVSTEFETTLKELQLDNPVVKIYRGFATSLVDLVFDDSSDYDYVHLFNMLKEFSSLENSVSEDVVPTLAVTVIPKEYGGDYFLAGLHPSWCAMPDEPGGDVNTIRFIFDNEFLHTFSSEAEDGGEDYEV